MGETEDRIADLARQYDEELVDSTLRRLARRQATSGKTCERCKEFKPLSEFSRHSRASDGRRRYCKRCAAEAERIRRQAKHQ